jgi:hypothetical protein
MLAALKQFVFQSDIPDSLPTLVIAELLAALKNVVHEVMLIPENY